MRAFIASGLVVVCCACSGGSGSSSGSGGNGSGGNGIGATCGEADTSVLEGAVTAKGRTISWAWVNIGKPAHFDGTFDGGSIHLEWNDSTPDGVDTPLTAATVTVGSSTGPRTFQSGTVVYDSDNTESTLKATLTFDTGTINVCMRKND